MCLKARSENDNQTLALIRPARSPYLFALCRLFSIGYGLLWVPRPRYFDPILLQHPTLSIFTCAQSETLWWRATRTTPLYKALTTIMVLTLTTYSTACYTVLFPELGTVIRLLCTAFKLVEEEIRYSNSLRLINMLQDADHRMKVEDSHEDVSYRSGGTPNPRNPSA
jgi:hypothetical protein